MTEDSVASGLLRQMFDLWVNPELNRRKEKGALGGDFRL
jgi:hypothetical protein